MLLRPWNTNDLESLVECANNGNISKFMMNKFPHPYTREAGEQFIAFSTKDDPAHILAIEVDGKAVGGIGIHPLADIECKNAEMGYWLAEPYWGRGIITEAVNRIFARPFGTNIPSQKVLEKTGFVLEAKFEKTFFKNGEYLDEWVYAIRR